MEDKSEDMPKWAFGPDKYLAPSAEEEVDTNVQGEVRGLTIWVWWSSSSNYFPFLRIRLLRIGQVEAETILSKIGIGCFLLVCKVLDVLF